jgi:endonuclease YncB( thermonuclease family)
MITPLPRANPWQQGPTRTRWLPAAIRPALAVYARSALLLAATTAMAVGTMASAPRAGQTAVSHVDGGDGHGERRLDRLTALREGLLRAKAGRTALAALFSPVSTAGSTGFAAAERVGPEPRSFAPRGPAANEWREEEFAAVAVVDGRTLAAGALRIRLVGLDLPMPEQVCRTLDGRLEHCTARAATQLELLTRWRKVTCRYRLAGAEEAVGHCRIGTSDLAERMVKSGYAWRSASAA